MLCVCLFCMYYVAKLSIQSLSHVCLFTTSWTAASQASLSITNSQSFLKLMSIKLVMPSSHPSSVIPFSSCLLSFPASGSFQMNQLFASSGQSIGVSASTSVLPNEHPGLISFRMDWFDLLAVQRTLKSLLQNQFESINSSTLCFLYDPTFTSIHDYWKIHILD